MTSEAFSSEVVLKHPHQKALVGARLGLGPQFSTKRIGPDAKKVAGHAKRPLTSHVVKLRLESDLEAQDVDKWSRDLGDIGSMLRDSDHRNFDINAPPGSFRKSRKSCKRHFVYQK